MGGRKLTCQSTPNLEMNAVKAIFLVQIAFAYAQPSNRNNCELEERCILAKECHLVRALLREGKRPKICGFNKESPKVCCPVEADSWPVSETPHTTVDGFQSPTNFNNRPWESTSVLNHPQEITQSPVVTAVQNTESPAVQLTSSPNEFPYTFESILPEIATPSILDISSEAESYLLPKLDGTSSTNNSAISPANNSTEEVFVPLGMAGLPVVDVSVSKATDAFPPLAQPENSFSPTSSSVFPTTSSTVPPIRTTPAALRVKTGCRKASYTLEPGLSRFAQIARTKCYEYANAVFFKDEVVTIPGSLPDCRDSCRTHETLIVGGQNAEIGQFPHMVLIGYGTYAPKNRGSYLCGGSLISEKFVLSAGHCAFPQSTVGLPTWVRFGELDLGTETESWSYDILINDVLLHPEYTVTSMYNDIALFELTQAVSFSPDVRPACISVSDVNTSVATVSGWGSTYYGDRQNNKLKYVSLNITSNEDCNATYGVLNKLRNGILPSLQICAGNTLSQDSCQGDSGGPLQVSLAQPYCMIDIIGVTSFGKQCGYATPGVYTRVTAYLKWIVENVWSDDINKQSG